ncbi:MAG: HAD hydrolase family protein [Bacteroides sp.]|nr:HAD hydrolase family protein [Bacteroides sp.]MCM1413994.1 HAD hydrolase family protein [Bacteroides sp.]MCM1472311.1 HAD hydrolase family protein [Bacteroides sp.]
MSSIDYDLTKIRGIAFDVDGVLSPSTIPMSAEGEPLRMVNIKDGYALQLAVKRGLNIAIISGAVSHAVEVRYGALGIKDIFTGAAHKLEIFERWMSDCGLNPEEVAFVGDDVPDYKPMMAAGLSVAPNDACNDILAMARYISPCRGGYGVARDLIEQVLRAKQQWMTDAKAFGW